MILSRLSKILILLFICTASNGQEVLYDLSESNTPVLNEELRKLRRMAVAVSSIDTSLFCNADGTNCTATGANPAGTGTEVQYRLGSTTFGAAANSGVTTTGNVGLGDTSPEATLEVAENGTVPFMVSNGAAGDGNFMIVNSVGNVGISTITPASRLDVQAGNITIPNTSSTTVGALFMGNNVSSTRFLHNYGLGGDGTDLNTFLGLNAGNFTNTGTTDTGVGYNALNALTTGGDSSAFGYGSLKSMTDGDNNSAFGSESLFSCTNCAYNVASGYRSMRTLTSGTDNTASGYRSLFAATDGTQNTASGSFALEDVVGGDGNSGFGYNTCENITTGDFNSCFGYGAGGGTGTPTGISYSSAIGFNAQVSESNNLILGSSGLGFNYVNVGIGSFAAHATLEITEAGTVPFMISNGYSADGDMVIVTSTGNMGIGTTVPTIDLEVQESQRDMGVDIDSAGLGGNNVSLLLHSEGSDASTTFTDSSQYSHSLTANGDAQIDTAQFKFGSASGLFDGTGDYLTMSSHSSIEFDSDFTFETWVRFNALPGTFDPAFLFLRVVDPSQDFVSFSIELTGGTSLPHIAVLIATASGGTEDFELQYNLPTLLVNTWYHIRWTRQDDSVYFFLDGVLSASDIVSDGALNGGEGGTIYISKLGASNSGYLDGWLDEYTIFTKSFGINDFPVPSAPYSGASENAGSPRIKFKEYETTKWTIGSDGMDADKFKIGTTALDTNTRLTIDSNGNVGIGAISPTELLTVAGGDLKVGNGTFDLDSSSDDVYVRGNLQVDNIIYSSANISIQDPTPDAELEIAELGTAPFMISNTADGNGDFLIVTSAGNVGVGTITPRKQLDVKGTATADTMYFQAATADTMFINNTTPGGSAGSDICIGSDNRLCICGSCN